MIRLDFTEYCLVAGEQRLDGVYSLPASYIKFSTSSKGEALAMGESLGQVFAFSNRSKGKDYESLKLGLIGSVKVGKTSFANAIINSYSDLEVVRRDPEGVIRFEGQSPSFGSILRADTLGVGRDEEERIVVCDRLDETGLGIVEHAQNLGGSFHMVVLISQPNTMEFHRREIRIYCEKGLETTKGYERFLEQTAQFKAG